MRILFLNDVYPGRQGALAACFAANPENEVLFASSYARQGFSLPGVRRVLLKTLRENGNDANKEFFEREWGRVLKVGRLAASSLLKLRETGFTPDMVLSSSAKGHALFVRQVFPKAFYVAYLAELFSSARAVNYYADKALLYHLLQSGYVTQSQAFFVFCQWQKQLFPAFMRDAIQVLPAFVDTDFFCAERAATFYFQGVNLSDVPELVSFSITSMESAHSEPLWRFITMLLCRRPHCHVVLSAARPEIRARLEAVTSLLRKQGESRMHIMDFLSLREYRDLLCASMAHVRLDAVNGRLGELLEIMSCETLLMTPFHEDSESTGVLNHDGNMVFCAKDLTEEDCHHLVEQLERPEALNALQARARKTALAFRQQDVLARHALRLTKSYALWKDGQSGQ